MNRIDSSVHPLYNAVENAKTDLVLVQRNRVVAVVVEGVH